MAKPNNQYEKLATEAAKRINQDRALGRQLTMLPDEAPEDETGQPIGRPKGAQNKGSSQLRDWLAAKGWHMPEDVIAQMAGLTGGASVDAIGYAMAQTERILAWAADGAAKEGKKGDKREWIPTGGQRLETFKALYAIQLRAAEALLPYGTPKAAGHEPPPQITQLILPGAATPSDPALAARDITPRPGQLEHVPTWQREIMEKQEVSGTSEPHSDDKNRTDEASS